MADTAKQPTLITADHRKTSIGSYESGNEAPPMPRIVRSQSLTTSTLPPCAFLPPDLENHWRKRRESLEKLQLDKVSPWMHMHDFSEHENSGSESATNSP